jgi:hypothetical protein
VQEHGGIRLAGEAGEVGLPLVVLVDLPDEGLVGDRVRLGDHERGTQRLVVIAREAKQAAGPAFRLLPQAGDGVGDI